MITVAWKNEKKKEGGCGERKILRTLLEKKSVSFKKNASAGTFWGADRHKKKIKSEGGKNQRGEMPSGGEKKINRQADGTDLIWACRWDCADHTREHRLNARRPGRGGGGGTDVSLDLRSRKESVRYARKA